MIKLAIPPLSPESTQSSTCQGFIFQLLFFCTATATPLSLRGQGSQPCVVSSLSQNRGVLHLGVLWWSTRTSVPQPKSELSYFTWPYSAGQKTGFPFKGLFPRGGVSCNAGTKAALFKERSLHKSREWGNSARCGRDGSHLVRRFPEPGQLFAGAKFGMYTAVPLQAVLQWSPQCLERLRLASAF